MSRAELIENFYVAMDTLRSHKGRAALTILGIVIGVTSVISVASIIEGLNGLIKDRFTALGSRVLFVFRLPAGTDPNHVPAKYRLRKHIDYYDAAYLRETCPDISMATIFGDRNFFTGQNNTIGYGAQRVERVFLRGAEPELTQTIPQFATALGRSVSSYDEEHARAVIVLGQEIANTLFPHIDPLGKMVKFNGGMFEVIGVFEADSGLFSGIGVNQMVVIPMHTFHKYYPEAKELVIAFGVSDNAVIDSAKDEVIAALRRRRHVPLNAENDFEVVSPDFFLSLWNQLTGALVLLTGIISSIGLLIGGIGVMNIMLISVTERTSEIGVRKAIGARKSDIRLQFLLEAMLLTCIGGLIGIALGGGIAFVVRHALPSIPASVPLIWVVLGVGMSAGVGIFFGYYPANRAANLDPIVCLRYE